MLTLEKINKIKDPIKRRKLKEDLVNADEAADRRDGDVGDKTEFLGWSDAGARGP